MPSYSFDDVRIDANNTPMTRLRRFVGAGFAQKNGRHNSGALGPKEQGDIEIRTPEQLGKRPRNTTNWWGGGSERAKVRKRGRPVFIGSIWWCVGNLMTLFRIFLESNFIWVTYRERSDRTREVLSFNLTTGNQGEIDMLSGGHQDGQAR